MRCRMSCRTPLFIARFRITQWPLPRETQFSYGSYRGQDYDGLPDMRPLAWLLVIAGFASAVVAFFIDAERPAANPWLLFIIGVGLAVVGIILIVLDRRA